MKYSDEGVFDILVEQLANDPKFDVVCTALEKMVSTCQKKYGQQIKVVPPVNPVLKPYDLSRMSQNAATDKSKAQLPIQK